MPRRISKSQVYRAMGLVGKIKIGLNICYTLSALITSKEKPFSCWSPLNLSYSSPIMKKLLYHC